METQGLVQSFKAAGVYLRVSTQQQGDRGLSEGAQEERCRKMADLYAPGCGIQIYRDVMSGTKSGRPGYQALQAAVERRGVDLVIAWSHDRLARSSAEWSRFLAFLQSNRVGLLLVQWGLVSFTPIGRLVLQIMGSQAEFESAQTGERVRAVFESRARGGFKGPGLRPFGWAVAEDRRLVAKDDEQRAIDLAVGMLGRGLSWASIAEALRDLKVSTVRGGPWTTDAARRAISSAVERRSRLSTGNGAVGTSLSASGGVLLRR